MSLHVSRAVWARSTAVGNDRLVLLAIADHANDDGTAWPGIRRLAAVTGLAESTVRRAVRRLAETGELLVTAGGGRVSSLYRVTLVDAVEPASPAHADTAGVSPRQVSPVTVTPQGCHGESRTSHRTGHVTQQRAAIERRERTGRLPRPVRLVLAATGATEAEAEAVVAAIVRERRPERVAGFVAALAADGELPAWLERVRAAAKADRLATAPVCARHPGQVAAYCGPCRSERIAAVTP